MTNTDTEKSDIRPSRRSQWGWFILLWLGGFLTLGLLSLIIKMIMGIA